MSTRQYQNRNSQNDDYMDDLYDRLSYDKRDTEADLAQNLTNSVKALSRRWLQEAYLDGMMLADKLHKVTSDLKSKQDDTQSRKNQNLTSQSSDSNDIALAVRQELQKLGLAPQKLSNQNSNSGFGNFLFGSVLILSGFFIIGGAISFYGLDSKVTSFVGQTYSSLVGTDTKSDVNTSKVANNTNQNTATPNNTPAPINTFKIASAQNPSNQTPQPSQSAPVIGLPDIAANTQNLTTTTQSNNQAALANNSNPASTQALPASCNGQMPQVNRPLNIQLPSDRAVLYCILDLQAQNQTPNQNQNNQTQNNTPTSEPAPAETGTTIGKTTAPIPSSIPQR